MTRGCRVDAQSGCWGPLIILAQGQSVGCFILRQAASTEAEVVVPSVRLPWAALVAQVHGVIDRYSGVHRAASRAAGSGGCVPCVERTASGFDVEPVSGANYAGSVAGIDGIGCLDFAGV